MASSHPVWHNIFRNIVLKPDNITFEAETYQDTLNILRGPGVAWVGSSDEDTILATGNDTFMINVDYDISIPVATTKLSLEDVNGNLSEVTFTAGRGVAIIRNSAQELTWESYSVTETDTLQSVTERNNITNNKIFVNNIEVGTISSSFTEDGFPSYDAGHNLIGDGTLDNALQFSPEYQDSLAANNTDQFEFTALGPGTLSYASSYQFDTGGTTGSVVLEREDPSNPGTWVVLDNISGVTAGYSYAIQGIYSELYSGNVNYRLTYSWTGNLGVVTWHVQNTFEGGAYTPITSPQFKTDTDAKTVDINDLQFFQNNIRTTVSNTDIVLDPAGTGQVVVLSNVDAPTFTGDLTGNVTGDVSGNAGTVTNGVYTTGSYADPSWITSLDAAKIVGSIQLSDITIDGDLRLFDNVISTSLSNSDIVLDPNGTGKVRSFSNIVASAFEGNLTGNADTVTNGVYTSGSYADPSWIISLNVTKLTGSVSNPSWLTSIDASKITGSVLLSDLTIDSNIRIYDNVIETSLSNSDLELRANGTGVVYISDSLTVLNSITFNTTTNNQSYTTTGAGTITITSGTAGNINNMNIGASTRGTGAFTTLDANSTVGLSPANAAVTISPTGTGSVTINPAAASTMNNVTITVPAGTTTVAPFRMTSGTNLSSVTAGALEYDGTVATFTTNTSVGRAPIQQMVFTSGISASNGVTVVASTNYAIFPAANDTITLPVGTYMVELNFRVDHNGTASNALLFTMLGAGGSTCTFVGQSFASTTNGGVPIQYRIPSAAATGISAAVVSPGQRIVYITGVLRVTVQGTIIPSIQFTGAAGTMTFYADNYMIISPLSSSASVASTGGWG